METTEIAIQPTNEGLVRAHVNIVFDNCFAVGDVRVMQGPTELYVSFPAKKQADGTHCDIAFPANAQTRQTIQQAILTKYEKIVAGNSPLPNANAR